MAKFLGFSNLFQYDCNNVPWAVVRRVKRWLKNTGTKLYYKYAQANSASSEYYIYNDKGWGFIRNGVQDSPECFEEFKKLMGIPRNAAVGEGDIMALFYAICESSYLQPVGHSDKFTVAIEEV